MGIKSRKSFTLIELLVVVAVIAILASVLLPALNKALEKARQVTCVNIMKSLGMANQTYFDNNNGVIYVGVAGDWGGLYNETNTHSNMASILYEISGTDKILCEYFPKTGISSKFVCKTAFDMLREANPASNVYKLCQELDSGCSRKNHVNFWRFYGMRMDISSTVSGSCFRTSTENGKAVWSHSITRVVSPSSSLFWSEGLYQLTKSEFNESHSALNAHNGKTTVLYFDTHVGSVSKQKFQCAHSNSGSADRSCKSCRFWYPYMK